VELSAAALNQPTTSDKVLALGVVAGACLLGEPADE